MMQYGREVNVYGHDEPTPGPHRGRGPRGYTRSDERIADDIHQRLTEDPYIDASDVEVSVNQCEVTLAGQVNSRWDRRRAEDIVENISGVRHVQNNLRVRQMGTTGSAGAFTGESTGSNPTQWSMSHDDVLASRQPTGV